AVIGDEDVGPAIAIEVGADDAEAGAGQPADAAGETDVGEAHPRSFAGAEVAVQLAARTGEHARATEVLVALGSQAVAFRVVIEVVDDDEIEEAVAVEVEEGSGHGPQGIVEAGLGTDVGEAATALVEEQLDGAVLGEQHVGTAIVVDVANRHAHVVAGHVEPGAGTDVGERAVGQALEQLILLAFGAAVVQQVEVD